ncbi:MAG: ADP-ribosylglycohydrolase family protein [Ignavibacteriales bacterium]|nr:ADP-ribosylglycohydrolase family protein [Ignavibacteriales bacterium]
MIPDLSALQQKCLEAGTKLLGAIAGDVIGSDYEFLEVKFYDFPIFPPKSNFTDDSVLTMATANKLISESDYTTEYRKFGTKYPHPKGSYGNNFKKWLILPEAPTFASFGNGSAMRVSPVGYAFKTMDETLSEAKKSAEVSHSHPEGIKGACNSCRSVFSCQNRNSKEIREFITNTFQYNLSRTCDEIRPGYHFDSSCQGTVPESIIAFLESNDFEDAIRLTISLGGDSDTMGAITGAIAEAFYGEVPQSIKKRVIELLPYEFLDIILKFNIAFI